jgi:prolyl-tRNA synthetase
VVERLQSIQDNLLARAKAHRAANTREIDTFEELKAYFTAKTPERPEIHGGFALCHWNGSKAVEKRLKEELKVTIRCIPLDAKDEPGKCVVTGEPSARRVVMAKAY